nr:MAG TPA: hypothetical protein [Caudoviricetes sp.]
MKQLSEHKIKITPLLAPRHFRSGALFLSAYML